MSANRTQEAERRDPGAGLSHHLGYAPGTDMPEITRDRRNATSSKSSPMTRRI